MDEIEEKIKEKQLEYENDVYIGKRPVLNTF